MTKHSPSLLSDQGREVRIQYLLDCVQLAADLGSPLVSLWAGWNFDGLSRNEAQARLIDGLQQVLVKAEALGVSVALEPEPGMFVETLDHYLEIAASFVGRPFGLALDLGHLMVTGELPIGEQIRRVSEHLLMVAVEDMATGVHKHLPFGEGDMDFNDIFQALSEVGYDGVVSVELSQASPNAVVEARRAWEFLQELDGPA